MQGCLAAVVARVDVRAHSHQQIQHTHQPLAVGIPNQEVEGGFLRVDEREGVKIIEEIERVVRGR